MKVLVFGATGKMGRAVVTRAIAAGHEVTAFTRSSIEESGWNARVATGNATNRADVDAAMRGQEAVIDTIGGKTPWKDTTLESSVARTIIASMHANGVRRLVVTSMLGVGESKSNAPFFLRLLVATFLRGANKDKAAMEYAVASSGLNWTILRPPALTDGVATGRVRVFHNNTDDKAYRISRADLATFSIDQLSSSTYIQKTVILANR